jgi:uridine kinase
MTDKQLVPTPGSVSRQRIEAQFTLGIGGGSGSGKSTIAAAIVKQLAPLQVEIIGLDRFFKPADELPRYHSAHDGEDHADYNRPDSLRMQMMVAECGKPSSADVVILDGHMVLCYPEMRQLLDLSCFVDAEIEEMLSRRTARNLAAKYGGSADTIQHYNRECVVPGYVRYILPSRQHADILIPNTDTSRVETEAVVRDVCERIRLACSESGPHDLAGKPHDQTGK